MLIAYHNGAGAHLFEGQISGLNGFEGIQSNHNVHPLCILREKPIRAPEKRNAVDERQTFGLEFGVPGVAVPPGIVVSNGELPFDAGDLNEDTDD